MPAHTWTLHGITLRLAAVPEHARSMRYPWNGALDPEWFWTCASRTTATLSRLLIWHKACDASIISFNPARLCFCLLELPNFGGDQTTRSEEPDSSPKA